MHTVWIPALHRDLTGGADRVEVEGATIGEVVLNLNRKFAGLADRLAFDNELRAGISVAVNGVTSSRGLRQRLPEPSEIHFIPSIAGGS